ncbi:MAG: hypothetical protein PHW74_01605 [Desulfobacca sp.]|nr:hypothetical protein [Desulfobacca sp.]
MIFSLVLIAIVVSPMAILVAASQGLAGSPAISAQEAVTVVQNLPEVRRFLGQSATERHEVVLHDEDPDRYILRLVMFIPAEGDLPARTTTVAWYAVDKATGLASSFTPGLEY